ncbi:MAG: hypothetical protein FH749_11555 [Firmicutes bacterium]|nr:hypothetical protein [Bacillota bacterium]
MAFIYGLGIAIVILMTAVALYILPSPFAGGVRGWFSLLWYLCALAAALGYWHKLDKAQARARSQALLRRLSRSRQHKKLPVRDRQHGV